MSITVDAVYEDGNLRPAGPLPLDEHEPVRLTIERLGFAQASVAEDPEAVVRRSYGLLGWSGDLDTLRRVAVDPEFDPQEGA